jgi:hypothetical protein
MATDQKKHRWIWLLLLLLLLWLWWKHRKNTSTPAVVPQGTPTTAYASPPPGPEPTYTPPPTDPANTTFTDTTTWPESDPNNPPTFYTTPPDLTGQTQIPAVNAAGSSLTSEGGYGTEWYPGAPLAQETIDGLNTWEHYDTNGYSTGLGLYQAYLNLQSNGADLGPVTAEINGAISNYVATHQWGSGGF